MFDRSSINLSIYLGSAATGHRLTRAHYRPLFSITPDPLNIFFLTQRWLWSIKPKNPGYTEKRAGTILVERKPVFSLLKACQANNLTNSRVSNIFLKRKTSHACILIFPNLLLYISCKQALSVPWLGFFRINWPNSLGRNNPKQWRLRIQTNDISGDKRRSSFLFFIFSYIFNFF